MQDRQSAGVHGLTRLWDIRDGIWYQGASQKNSLLVSWGYAACQALAGNPAFRISALYLEYANVEAPGDTVSVPTFSVYDGLSYYSGLSSPADYLRVPVLGNPLIQIASGYEDYFSQGTGNELQFMAQSAGSVGQNGLPFGSAQNSTVYGLALVATPVWADPTQDVLISRAYYSAPNQKCKSASCQIGVSWNLTFEPQVD